MKRRYFLKERTGSCRPSNPTSGLVCVTRSVQTMVLTERGLNNYYYINQNHK
jgi:hypothetical protein